MWLKSIDNDAELGLTIAGYESLDYLSDRDTANWLEIDVSVQTAHGRGVSRVPCMHTWDAVTFATWLAAFDSHHPLDQNDMLPWLCPEPNLQFQMVSQAAREVIIHVYFILEQPGEWEMDDAKEGRNYYIGTMDLKVRRTDLRAAAESLRAELQHFPVRNV